MRTKERKKTSRIIYLRRTKKKQKASLLPFVHYKKFMSYNRKAKRAIAAINNIKMS
jgi:hypothetical protein